MRGAPYRFVSTEMIALCSSASVPWAKSRTASTKPSSSKVGRIVEARDVVRALDDVFLARLGHDSTIFDSKVDIWVEAAQFYGQADVSVVCGAIHSHTVKKNGKVLGEAITNPQIIVEVLSPSTAARDRGEKFEAYKQALSLKEYVLVSQDERRVEVRRRDERGWSVDVAGPGDTLRIHGHDISVDTIYSTSST